MSIIKNKKVIYTIAALLVIIVITFIFFEPFFKKKSIWDTSRNIRYSYALENKTSKALQNVVFKTYSPMTISSTQKLNKLTSTQKYTTTQDKFHNQIMEFNIDFIAPYGKKTIIITAELLLSKIAAGSGSEDDLFISEQPLMETNNKKIIELANNLKNQSEELQKTIFNWLVDNIEYSGYGMRDRGALFALENLHGDCTEYAYLNVALNRALGFKSRAVNGYVVDHDAKLSPTEFHTWSEVWLNGGWQVIDAQKKSFLENQENYIAMNVVIDTQKHTQAFKRFWVSSPDLIVTMN